MRLYKYRTLKNFQFLLDIIVNKRLYAGKYLEMNDPMEGVYTHQSSLLDEQHKAIADALSDTKFCSLSQHHDDPLLWAHYADGNRGCVIEVELPQGVDCRPVIYSGPSHINIEMDLEIKERAKRILTHKAEWWNYEQEVRVFPISGSYIDNIIIHEVIIGEKADRTEAALLRKIIEKVEPSVSVIDRRNSKSRRL
ncbi:DUF2971 domain-containing protein [Vibrio parahaemolyticus]|uniref:DUF2971 domain-containing protein n=1 Tax=Vibrio parahaemolyticus TaxID=670 RepID=A0A7Y0XCL4_VIBPH|nr:MULTISPECIES: DUF2971 domain-containing protein [Gammaproteobacteria]MDF4558991.1 DUF2971 domain-containing protein [Vibrio parahaemolyticus]MDF5019524.1 DUF2971 domain-containing protein [Vibrio parahaemolyticus]MDF5024039.1 DUF2971 domain-containing protein [Vibrio parahaemolyticus]MDF5043460.1 DUF2971 domain-containing protein [Vibrio parahaemolyticus]MDF5093243.1 DUF2971 domain-containing protein [Vibrio parahaemolyticus]